MFCFPQSHKNGKNYYEIMGFGVRLIMILKSVFNLLKKFKC